MGGTSKCTVSSEFHNFNKVQLFCVPPTPRMLQKKPCNSSNNSVYPCHELNEIDQQSWRSLCVFVWQTCEPIIQFSWMFLSGGDHCRIVCVFCDWSITTQIIYASFRLKSLSIAFYFVEAWFSGICMYVELNGFIHTIYYIISFIVKLSSREADCIRKRIF